MSYFDPQNPGLSGLDELTEGETLFLTTFAGLAYQDGDILYYNSGNIARLPKGTDTQVLTLTSGLPAWEDAAGGGGTPGGSDTQLQYNNAGAFGGISGATSNGTTLTLTSGRATTDFSPTTSDGASLGTSSLMFSDLFLASGGVANWNNGNVTLTHATDSLTFSGGASTTFIFSKKVGFNGQVPTAGSWEAPLGDYLGWYGVNGIPSTAYIRMRGYLSGNNPQFDINCFSGGITDFTYTFTSSGITAPGVVVGATTIANGTVTTKVLNLNTSTGTDALYISYLRSGIAALGASGFAGSDGTYQVRLGGNSDMTSGTQVQAISTSSFALYTDKLTCDSSGNLVIAGNLTIEASNIITDTTTGTKIGTATTQKLGFFNATPVVQPTALTTQLTTVTFSNPGTPDYAIQDLTNIGGYGFVTSDEAQTVLSVIANLQTRVGQLETKLQALGLVA